MNVLIDTHIFLWAVGIEGSLSAKVRKLLEDPDVSIFFSAVSAWEISIKWSKGRLILPERPPEFIGNVMASSGMLHLPITLDEASSVADLPIIPHHKDPFDRLLVVQAKANRLRLLTADPKLEQYEIDVILCNRKR